MNDLAVPPSAGVTLTGLQGQNPFDVVFRPAKPTFDAIVQMQPAVKWLERHRPGRPIDPEFLKVIPTEQELLHSKALFRLAEREPAPEAWTEIAVAMMADSMPAAHRVSDAYVCAIIDGAYQDHEVWEGYSILAVSSLIDSVRSDQFFLARTRVAARSGWTRSGP
jgi:hypothetical protein